MELKVIYDSNGFDPISYRKKIPELLKLNLQRPPKDASWGNGVRTSHQGYHEYYTTSPWGLAPMPGSYAIDTIKNVIMDGVDSPLRNRRAYLEIGPGPGQYLKLFAPYFESVTAVEPSVNMQTEWKQEAEANNWNVFTGTFEDFTPPKGQKYDLIYASHMLYHVNVKLWPKFLEKLYDLLSEGGMAIVTMVADQPGVYDIYKTFAPSEFVPSIGQVREYFKYRGIHVDMAYESQSACFDTFQETFDFLHFTIVEGVQFDYHNLSEYESGHLHGRIAQLTLNAKTRSGKYEIPCCHGFCTVQNGKQKSKL